MTAIAVLTAVALLTCAGAHLALVLGLARRARWRAPIALLVAPLAPYWGWKAGLHRTTALWCVGVGAYAVGVMLLIR